MAVGRQRGRSHGGIPSHWSEAPSAFCSWPSTVLSLPFAPLPTSSLLPPREAREQILSKKHVPVNWHFPGHARRYVTLIFPFAIIQALIPRNEDVVQGDMAGHYLPECGAR